jgi:thiol-disulfide isomerase/thioredoxin
MTALLLAVAVTAALAQASCDRQARPASPAAPVAAGAANGSRASDFQIAFYQGGEIFGGKEARFSELLAQGKPIVLNFWAGACAPCRVEMPEFQAVSEKYKARVLFFGLDVGPFVGLGSREEGQALLKDLKVHYPAGTTFDAEVIRKYNVLGMPTTLFIQPNGTIFRKWTGLLTKQKLESLLEEVLAASAKT